MLVLSSPRFDHVLKARPHIPRGRALAYTILLSSLQIDVAIAHDMYTLCICQKFVYIYMYIYIQLDVLRGFVEWYPCQWAVYSTY